MEHHSSVDESQILDLLLRALGVPSAYSWQREAFIRLCAGDPPSQIKVPTAAGKTLIIPVFVAALASQAIEGRVTLPRRLVHVVNRRILVDEASHLGDRLLDALRTSVDLEPVRNALSRLSASGQPLALTTLRGGVGDNGAWSLDPSTPAIIFATPDMLGSRLLFRGYGVGRSRSASHAGVLGCDTLVVHDEAHLAPAFTTLLRQVESMAAPGARLIGRPPLQVIEMTATLSSKGAGRPLVADVGADAALAARMGAPKRLQLIDARKEAPKAVKPAAAILDTVVDEALTAGRGNKAVAIFVSSPGMADAVASRLTKAQVDPHRIVTLTGTMRGLERVQLVESPAFRRFDPGPISNEDATAYFIATSAGEIGLDIDADVGLFDLTTIDRFIQRSGRINRRGQSLGDIRVIHCSGEELPAALAERGQAALKLLLGLPLVNGTADASPIALSRLCDLEGYIDATEPPPAIRMLEPGVVCQLSMTSLRLDELGCPSPDVFIHGLVEEDADLKLAWRDLPRIGTDVAEWLDVWPIAQVEQAKLPIDAARRLIVDRLMAAQRSESGALAVALDSQGMPASDDSVLVAGMAVYRWANRLRPGSIVLLSSEVGGLNAQGIPSASSVEPVQDVSAGFTDANGLERVTVRRLSVSCHMGDDGIEWRSGELTGVSLDGLLQLVAGDLEIAYHDGPTQLDGLDWAGPVNVWLSRRSVRSADAGDLASMIGRERLLDEHLDLAARAARRLCASLGLPSSIASAEMRAAAEHDRGKAWERWQRAVGNVNPARPLGKSASPSFNFRVNDGYRHELGSVVDRGSEMSTLERHLVASHHGWCRPGFRDAALSKPGCAGAASACADGYADLNGGLGPWALSYLEAVLKSADVLAEVLDVALAADPPLVLPALSDFPVLPPCAKKTFELALDVTNFGEYLAGLGLVALLTHRDAQVRFGWSDRSMVIEGADDNMVRAALQSVAGAVVTHDSLATVLDQREAPYPPMQLRLSDGVPIALNHWLDERLRTGSRWKLGAGQTSAAVTLERVAKACADTLALPDFNAERLLMIGGGRVGADASKFRFDAATNWSARDAGFSLNESDAFKSTRPWVELLSALGLQNFFPPPADSTPVYYTWTGTLSPTLAMAAVKGLLPQCDIGYRTVIEPNGKMKDVFTSQQLPRERKSACPAHIRVI